MAIPRLVLSLALSTQVLVGCKAASSVPADEPPGDAVAEAPVTVEPVEPVEPVPAPMSEDSDTGEPVDVAGVAAATDGEAAPTTTTVGAEPESPAKVDEERAPLPKPVFGDSAKTSCRKQLAVGDKVKSFKLQSVDGKKTISPGAYRGRVVLLNFWATWCKPCIKELPEFDRLYRKYRGSGFTLVTVATDAEAAGVQAIVDDLKLAARVAIGGEQAAAAYDHPNFPFSFVVDGNGKIVAAYDKVDESCLSDLESVLRDELEKLD